MTEYLVFAQIDTVAPFAQLFKEYGPWALVAVQAFAIRFLYHECAAANARTVAMAERIIPLVSALLPLIQELEKSEERRERQERR